MIQDPGCSPGCATLAREFSCSYIEEIPVVALALFMDHYMPERVVSHNPAIIAQSLSQRWRSSSRPLQTWADVDVPEGAPLDLIRRRWTKFPVDPTDIKQNEPEVYSAFEEIFDQIVACCTELEPGLRQRAVYFNEGDPGARQSLTRSVTKPDASIRILSPHGTFYGKLLYVRAVAIHLRKSGSDRLKNGQRVNWELLETLRAEPGRRFAFGMTVENTSVRLWHFNHEVMVVSSPFDFQKDYETFIDVLCRFAFAPFHQLGYDPTFIKGTHIDKDALQHDRVIIENKTYELFNVVANHCADAVVGRCSWVWDAVEVDSGTPVVVKDCWVEDDRLTEFDILKDIHQRIRAYDWKADCVAPCMAPLTSSGDPAVGRIDPHYHDDVDRTAYFVNIICGQKLFVDGQVDNTRSVMARGYQLPPTVSCDMYNLTPQPTEMQPGTHAIGTEGDESQDDTVYIPMRGVFDKGTKARAHHRLVMSRGTPLDKILDPRLAFRTLRDASYSIFIMHCIGYLHRDPSAPNILLTETGLGVLADLEYAIPLSQAGQPHIGRVGTPNYMAIEVVYNNYLQQPNHTPLPPLAEEDVSDVDITAFTAPSTTSTPWTRCELHDIESFFWIALWLLFRHTSSRHMPTAGANPILPGAEALSLSSPQDDYDLDAHRDMYNRMFPHAWKFTQFERRDILCVGSAYQRALSVLPPSFRKTALYFEYLRRALLEQYGKGSGRVISGSLWGMLYRLCANGARFMPEDSFVPLSTIAVHNNKSHT
ncbi:hypothetical protein C8Q79DRAFT_776212 [Trametes meyenii]|nr:hypothetical protein C8Q79DRAFT_776212 [Trametes meyenii]